jgi:hypothetical protein
LKKTYVASVSFLFFVEQTFTMTKKKEVYAVSETPEIKGMINEILSFGKNLFIIFL